MDTPHSMRGYYNFTPLGFWLIANKYNFATIHSLSLFLGYGDTLVKTCLFL